MLTPLQSSQSTAIVSTLQSMIEKAEERAREEADKAAGRDKDDNDQAHLKTDEAARRANARVNEHFFGVNARSGDTLAKLITRLSETLGVAQQAGETSLAFAQRLSDRLALTDSITITNGDKAGPITLAQLGTTLEAVKTAMAGGKIDDAAARLVARLAAENSVAQGAEEPDEDFEARLSILLTDLRGYLPSSKETLEKKTGLADLGLKAEDVVEAIRNPYGPEAQRIKDALAEKARQDKALTPEMQKVLARLEDVANPKSIEELKLERTTRDPTRVEDAETKAEREETIRALEAGEKLEDALELQDAIAEANKAAVRGGDVDGADGAVVDALETIQLLAAGAAATAARKEPTADSESTGADVENVETTEEALRALDQARSVEDEARENAKKDIFALRVDENGIYDLITRQIAPGY